ncbi:MAG: ATP-binding cassette domain-containing protein, partial [Acidobacteria bacterium]|nr:ATP-binding cassette domain-containing protein [Acidobacteriota bacterium]
MYESCELLDLTVPELLARYPFLDSFLDSFHLAESGDRSVTLRQRLDSLDEETLEDRALDPAQFIQNMTEYIRQMNEFLGEGESLVESVTILPGTDKSGRAEAFDRLDIRRGEIVCIVGPTGSGKSRLLGDIEWVAQQDTPTGRRILINDEVPETRWRFSAADKLVAQLSQNMNFVMDLTVREFLELHAESRLVADPQAVIERIIAEANRLAGEKFAPDTPVTSLSGG